MGDKKKSIILPNVPDDIYAIIKEEQRKREIECDCKKSMEKIIYALIRKAKKIDSSEIIVS